MCRTIEARTTARRREPGGYAMLAGVIAGVWSTGAWRDGAAAVILAGAIVLAILAFIDDRRPLPRLLRAWSSRSRSLGLVVWGLAPAAGAPRWPASPVLAWIAWTGALVWVVGLVNTYNFMDGLNGMVGVAAVVTGSLLAVLALRRGDLPAAVLATSVAAAAAGFSPFNLLTGSIFLGDSGSTAVGLIFGALVLDASGPGVPSLAPAFGPGAVCA